MAESSSFYTVIKTDLEARKQTISLVRFFIDPITRFHWYLRLTEFLKDRKFFMPLYLLSKLFYLRLSQRLGFSIPLNTLAPGVYIPHWGTIVVNEYGAIGPGCTLNVGVVVGRHPKIEHVAPRIGSGVYIGPGVVIYGDISIGDGCVIGANSVVSSSFEGGQLIVGAPARSRSGCQ